MASRMQTHHTTNSTYCYSKQLQQPER